MQRRSTPIWLTLLLLALLAAAGCGRAVSSASGGTATDWVRCDDDDVCPSDTSCSCGICTRACDAVAECEGLPAGAVCADTPGACGTLPAICAPDRSFLWLEGEALASTSLETTPLAGITSAPSVDLEFTDVAAGYHFTCAIRAGDGETQCWGANGSFGLATPPLGVKLSRLAAGYAHVCGLRASDGTALCWGDPLAGEPPQGVAFTSLAAAGGGFLTCGIRAEDGQAQCWSDDVDNNGVPENPFPGVRLASLSVGGSVCGIRESDRRVECFPGLESDPPADVAFSQVSVGGEHACGVRADDGEVECWGRNDAGQATPPGGRYTSVYAGAVGYVGITCGIPTEDGPVTCWGTDVSSSVYPETTFPTDRAASTLALGWFHGCLIDANDGRMACWGVGDGVFNPSGEAYASVGVSPNLTCFLEDSSGRATCRGIGIVDDFPVDTAYRSIAVGDFHACAIRQADGEVDCIVGDPAAFDQTDRTFAGITDAPVGAGFDALSAGVDYTCGKSSTGVSCWGSPGSVGTPPEGVVFSSFSAGPTLACGVRTSDGLVQCWQGSAVGSELTPPDDVAFRSVAVGANHVCGIRESDGEAQCWGSSGQTPPPSGVAFSSLSASDDFTCGIRAEDERAQCWGSNDYGDPPGDVRFKSLSTTRFDACGIRSQDGVEVCWGSVARNLWRAGDAAE